MSESSKVEQAAQIVRKRLVNTEGTPGLKILGRDVLGNWRGESLLRREWNFASKGETPAQIIIAPIGQSFINQHPGFLRAIDKGDLSPLWISEKGSSSLVVHTDKFPEVVIKYMRFSPSQTIKEWQKPLMPGMSRDLSRNPDATYHMTQVATGIDHLYWKQMVAKVLKAKGMRTATPFLATRDVLVEEHIIGPNLLDFLRQVQQGCSEQEFKQLAESLTEITEPIYEKSLEMFREEAAKGEALPYQLPTTFDMSPPRQWKENPVKDGRVVSHSSLANWIVTDEEGGVESLKNLSQAEQQQWFKDRLVLIDPFADFAYLTKEEVEAYKHSIPRTLKPTDQFEKTETAPATAEGIQEETKPGIVEQRAPRKLTRRTALKALAGVGGAIVLGKEVKQRVDGWRESAEEAPAESFRKDLEKRFNINIFYDMPSIKWNLERLKILEEVLSSLPEHFYSFGDSNKKMSITIDEKATLCVCDQDKPEKPEKIYIGRQFLGSVETARSILAHELTHAIMPMQGPQRLRDDEGWKLTSP